MTQFKNISNNTMENQNTSISMNNENRIKLSELVEIVPASGFNENEGYLPTLGYNELGSNYLNCNISFKDLLQKDDFHFGHTINTNCLLVGFLGGKFKVGKAVDFSASNKVKLFRDIIPLKLKSDIMTENFLLRSIMSEDVEKQANLLAKGNIVSRIIEKDFLNIKIVVPSKEKQEELCNEDIRKCLEDVNRKLSDSFDDFQRDKHMKKHVIGQTICDFSNWWSVLQRARRENDGVLNDSTIVGNIKPITVGEIYDNLQNSVARLQQQIYKIDRGYGLKIETFALTDFIEDYINNHKNSAFQFIYDAEKHHEKEGLPDIQFDESTGKLTFGNEYILKKGDPIEFVSFSPEALTIVFDNIVSNACSHGFTDNNAKNAIRIELFSEGSNYIVTIANNGKPIHEKISQSDIFTYGISSKSGKGHFGIGGYEIKKLMQDFNGDAEVISTPSEEFAVSYRLIFFNTNIMRHFDINDYE